MNRLPFEKLKTIIDEHRQRWPVDRIVAQPNVFRAESETVLRHIETIRPIQPHADWPDEFWTRLLFDEPAEAPSDAAGRLADDSSRTEP